MNNANQVSEPVDYVQVLDLFIEHKSVTSVARLLGAGVNTARSWLKRMDITLPTPEQIREGTTVEDLNGAEKLAQVRARLAASPAPVLSAKVLLRTLDLWLDHRRTADVAAILGLTPRTILHHLKLAGVKLRSGRSRNWLSSEEDLAEIRRELVFRVEQEASDTIFKSRRPKPTPRLTAAQKLEALERYIELGSLPKVAKCLGLPVGQVDSRIRGWGLNLRPRGAASVRFEDVNDPAEIQAVLERLRAAAAQERQDTQGAG